MASEILTITLPKTFAEAIRRKVSSGEFESEADVIVSALMALDDEAEPHDEATIEKWLKEVGVPIALRMEANPDEGYTGEQVLAHLEEDLKTFRKKHHAA